MFANLTSGLEFHSKALVLCAERQRIIASNIANADTPGYVARDINFQQALSESTGARQSELSGASRRLSTSTQAGGVTHARHMALTGTSSSELAGASNLASTCANPASRRWQQRGSGPRTRQLCRQLGALRIDLAFYQWTFQNAAQRHSRSVSAAHPKEPTMSMFSIFNVSGSAISAQSQRLNVVARTWPTPMRFPDRWPGFQGATGGVSDDAHGLGRLSWCQSECHHRKQ